MLNLPLDDGSERQKGAIMECDIISLVKTKPIYPNYSNNYRPSARYPEYQFNQISDSPNYVYDAVRESLALMGLDEDNFGTPEWNPLHDVVHEGDTVLIKPNLVMDVNGLPNQGTECLYTQPSVVAAVIDYVLIALKGTGRIVIGDAPMQECVFERILVEGGYNRLVEYYRKLGAVVEIVDFRELTSTIKNGVHIKRINESARGTVIDLGDQSEFYGTSQDVLSRARITNYDPRILPTHHDSIRNEYYISNYILDADVIINMPKPKSHRKAGVTIALKNFVGANVRKEYLPHHTLGSVQEGGDEYLHKDSIHALRSSLFDRKNTYEAEERYNLARLCWLGIKGCSLLMKMKRSGNYHEGSWYGNNTISKTIADINKIVFYADKSGRMCSSPQRRMLIVADMIISGENEGPVYPAAKKVGMIACGLNPVSFDIAVASLMGFNPDTIPTLLVANSISGEYQLCSCSKSVIVSNVTEYNRVDPRSISRNDSLCFEPSSGWKGHIEKKC